MNLKSLKFKASAGAAFAAAGVLLAVALGLFLYCWLKNWFEPAIAAGLSFLAFAVVAGVAGLIFGAMAHPRGSAQSVAGPGGGLPERALELVRRRPIVSLAVGAVAVVVALRNPALLATLAGAALSRPPARRR